MLFQKFILIACLIMCLITTIVNADQTDLLAVEDVYLIVYHGSPGQCGHTFMKFDISSIPTGETIDSVFLYVYVFHIDSAWDGNCVFRNVNSQAWIEGDSAQTIWNIPTSDSTAQPSDFGTTVGYTKSVDLTSIFLRDYDVGNAYTTLKLSDYNLPGGTVIEKIDSDDSLVLGGFQQVKSIRFRPHEIIGTPEYPYLSVYHSGIGVESPSNNLQNSKKIEVKNSPNPFSKTTVISFQCPVPSDNTATELSIYDLSGRLVKSFSLFTPHSSLSTAVSWDGKNNNGQQTEPGVYFCIFEKDGQRLVRKMIKM